MPEISFNKAALGDIPVITEFVENELSGVGCSPKVVMRMCIAIDELYSNIVRYAYGERTGPAWVRVELCTEPQGVALVFEDEGMAYDPLKNEDPDITAGADERRIGGLGIFMVKKSMDDVRYQYLNGRNSLRIFKNFE